MAQKPKEQLTTVLLVINQHAAGIDIGSRNHYVAIGQNKEEVRCFGVYSDVRHLNCRIKDKWQFVIATRQDQKKQEPALSSLRVWRLQTAYYPAFAVANHEQQRL